MAQFSPFQLFGLKPTFAVDLTRLEAAYQAAMMKVHPDRFADRSPAERRVAEQWSTRINEAYELLKSPVKRAEWLCEAAGHPLESETNTRMPTDFLMKQIEWREALESAEGNQDKIAALRQETEAVRSETEARLAQAIDGSADWACAVDLTRRLMFIGRFLDEVTRAEKKNA